MEVTKLNILLIEDDTIEIMKLQRTLSKLNLNHNVIEATNGEEALKILKQNTAKPNIILLDLNMPKMNGIEFLTTLKADATLKYLPTIVFTTSNNQKDLLECYKIGISGYVIKPLKYKDYVEKLDKILTYWCVNEIIKE